VSGIKVALDLLEDLDRLAVGVDGAGGLGEDLLHGVEFPQTQFQEPFRGERDQFAFAQHLGVTFAAQGVKFVRPGQPPFLEPGDVVGPLDDRALIGRVELGTQRLFPKILQRIGEILAQKVHRALRHFDGGFDKRPGQFLGQIGLGGRDHGRGLAEDRGQRANALRERREVALDVDIDVERSSIGHRVLAIDIALVEFEELLAHGGSQNPEIVKRFRAEPVGLNAIEPAVECFQPRQLHRQGARAKPGDAPVVFVPAQGCADLRTPLQISGEELVGQAAERRVSRRR
jgi:hypothetical protein